jgi:hypothetical protein
MGGETSVAQVLESLRIEGPDCEVEQVTSVACDFVAGGVDIVVGRKHDPDSVLTTLLDVFFAEAAEGTGTTPDVGYVEVSQLECFPGATSQYSFEPCELELQELERGVARESESGVTVEVGSRVRVRVSCPEGLYSLGNDEEYGSHSTSIAPAEFILEAQDCTLSTHGDD